MDGGGGSWHKAVGASTVGSPGAGSNLMLLPLRALCFSHSGCIFSAVCSPQHGSEETVSLFLPPSDLLTRATLTGPQKRPLGKETNKPASGGYSYV